MTRLWSPTSLFPWVVSVIALIAGEARGQDFVSAKSIGGGGLDYAFAVTTDAAGSVISAGVFRDTVDFDPGPGIYNLMATKDDAWVAKLDAGGSFVWARQLAGPESSSVSAVVTDADGNVYLTGQFEDVADFDPGPGTYNLGFSPGQIPQLFVWKLSSAGDLVWARAIPGLSSSAGSAIALDSAGNVLVTGTFSHTVDFDPGPGTFALTSAGFDDVFVLKLDNGGNFVWARRIGGPSPDFGRGLAVDGADRVVVAGSFFGTVDFDPGAGAFPLTAALDDAFVLMLASDGTFVWARQIGGGGHDTATAVRTTADGGVVVVGNDQGTTDLDPGPGNFPVTSHGGDDFFVVKLDSTGAFRWGGGFGGTSLDHADALAIGPGGDIYVTGEFSDTVDFDPGPGLFSYSSKNFGLDVFVLKLDSQGAFAWAAQLGGDGNEEGTAITVAGSDQVITAGYFSAVGDYDPGVGTFSLSTAGSNDVFISRLADAFAVPVVHHVPADFATIQEAIDHSRHRDTILVAPGTYDENLDFHGQHVVVQSEQGQDVTILDGGAHGSVVTIQTGEDQTTVLAGFTIRNGVGSSPLFEGGGVRVQGRSSPTVRDNLITQNVACGEGGGIVLRTGSAVIEGNEIRGNGQVPGCSGGLGGGGIAALPARDDAPIIQDNVITGNFWGTSGLGGGGVTVYGGSTNYTVVARNRIFSNSAGGQGGGATIQGTPALLIDNLIFGNAAPNGGGLFVFSAAAGPIDLVNNTVADNTGTAGAALFLDGPGVATLDNNILVVPLGGGPAVSCGSFIATPPVFHSNDVYAPAGVTYSGTCANPGGSNFASDPRFLDPAAQDYRLWPASPAVDRGDNMRRVAGFLTDVAGGPRFLDEPETPDTGIGATPIVDLGAFETGLTGTAFYTVTPCRLLDTRNGSPLQSGVRRIFPVATACAVPAAARAIAANVTVVDATGSGYLNLFNGDALTTATSVVNFKPSRAIANNAILRLARDGSGSVAASAFLGTGGTVQLILDVVGYFQ